MNLVGPRLFEKRRFVGIQIVLPEIHVRMNKVGRETTNVILCVVCHLSRKEMPRS